MRFLAVVLLICLFAGGVFAGVWSLTRQQTGVTQKDVVGAKRTGPLSGAFEDDDPVNKILRPMPFLESVLAVHDYKGEDVNISQAVLRLGLEPINPNSEPTLVVDYPSFHAAYEAAAELEKGKESTLVSASMVYWKSRQFNEGILAALELALLEGKTDSKVALVDLVQDIFNALDKSSATRAYLAAALDLAGRKVDVFPEEVTRRNMWLSRYRSQILTVAPPYDFFEWNEQLRQSFNFERFLMEAIPRKVWFIVGDIAKTLKKNPELLQRYESLVVSYELLYRPRHVFTVLDVAKMDKVDDSNLRKMFSEHADYRQAITFLPIGPRREQIHFNELMPIGLMPGLQLFPELVQRSDIGFVPFINPDGKSGIEQLHAQVLDALIAEQHGMQYPESDKIMLDRVYRERMFSPFLTSIESVVSTDEVILPTNWKPTESGKVAPVLRVEPVPTFYLRLGRAFAYMDPLLKIIIGEDAANTIKRVTPDGKEPELTIKEELASMKDLAFGLYLLCCEDLGTDAVLGRQDEVNRSQAMQVAEEWLLDAWNDPVFQEDCRFSVPIHVSGQERMVTLWASLGARLNKMTASYESAPQLRAKEEGALWRPVGADSLATAKYLLPVLDIGGLDIRSRYGISSAELQKICDENKSRNKITAAIMAMEAPAVASIPGAEPVDDPLAPQQEPKTPPGQERRAPTPPPGTPDLIP